MSKLSSFAQVQPSDLYLWTSTQGADLGAKASTGDGREFVYVKAGASALVPGTLIQGPAVVANLTNATVSAAVTAGSYSVSLTISSTTVTEGEFVGGLLIVNDEDGQGQVAKISNHTYGTSITSITFTLEDAIAIALTTSSQCSVLPNTYNGVIINPTTPTNKPVGVAISAIAASNYGWIQTKGLASCLNDGGTAVGLAVAPSQGTAGAVKTGATTLDSIGSAAVAGVTTEYSWIDIRL